MKLICVQAYADKRPGDEVDLPVDPPGRGKDGGYLEPPPWSELYLAEPDRVEARRASAARKAADEARAAAKPAGAPPPAATPLTPPATTPLAQEGA